MLFFTARTSNASQETCETDDIEQDEKEAAEHRRKRQQMKRLDSIFDEGIWQYNVFKSRKLLSLAF